MKSAPIRSDLPFNQHASFILFNDRTGSLVYSSPGFKQHFPETGLQPINVYDQVFPGLQDKLKQCQHPLYLVLESITGSQGMSYIKCRIEETGEPNLKILTLLRKEAASEYVPYEEFYKYIESHLYETGGNNNVNSMVLFDIQGFKDINDIFGFDIGDMVLQNVISHITWNKPPGSMICRLGVDRFCIYLESCSQLAAQDWASELIRSVSQKERVYRDNELSISLAAGITESSFKGQTADSMLDECDKACDASKLLGHNNPITYEDIKDELKERHNFKQQSFIIKNSILDNRISLFYQNIYPINIIENNVVIYEVLARLGDEGNSLIYPASFIGYAESNKLINMIDEFVIKSVMETHLQNMSVNDCSYSVNISGRTLSDSSCMNNILSIITENKTNAPKVMLEITETAKISDIKTAVKFMERAKELGCRIALDDFGAGLSSLFYLNTMPLDIVKIDGQFIRGMNHNSENYKMVETINRLSHSLLLKTVAEFVENKEIYDTCANIGIDYAQGYYLHKPEIMSRQTWTD